MKPRVSLLDRNFKYVPSHQTDVRETFERARRELQQAERDAKERAQKCIQMKGKR